MQNSNAVVKKIYCIVINGKIQEKLDFDSMEIAKDYIKLFSLKYRQENTIAIREIYRITIELFKPFYKNKTVMIQEANVFTSYIMNDYIIKEGEE